MKILLKNRRVVFVLSYPFVAIVIWQLARLVSKIVFEHSIMYGFIVFFVCGVMIALALVDLFTNFLHHKNQGAKLNMRKQMGLNLDDVKGKNHGH